MHTKNANREGSNSEQSHSIYGARLPAEKELAGKLYPYYKKRDELIYKQKILMWNNRILIPECLKQRIMEQIHESHTGIVAMKYVARMSAWGPCIDQDDEKTVKNCIECGEHQSKAPETPLLLWNNTGKPWDRVHTDLAFLNGETWLFVIDSHSHWLEIFKLKHVTSEEVIEYLKKLFSSYGICCIIVSDKGPQFTSAEFRNFLQ